MAFSYFYFSLLIIEMKISFKDNTITCVDECDNYKKHLPLFTSFTEIDILKDGRLLICEDYYHFESKEKSNLYCLNRSLGIDWFLPLPNLGFDDWYVGFTTHGENVFANSWNGFRVEVDIETGTLKDVIFTK